MVYIFLYQRVLTNSFFINILQLLLCPFLFLKSVSCSMWKVTMRLRAAQSTKGIVLNICVYLRMMKMREPKFALLERRAHNCAILWIYKCSLGSQAKPVDGEWMCLHILISLRQNVYHFSSSLWIENRVYVVTESNKGFHWVCSIISSSFKNSAAVGKEHIQWAPFFVTKLELGRCGLKEAFCKCLYL